MGRREERTIYIVGERLGEIREGGRDEGKKGAIVT